MKIIKRLILICICFPILLSCSKKEQKPNVIFILTDQWRASALGYAGNDIVQTPRIDKFSKEAINFKNTVSVLPVCTPYRASLLTGRYPTTTGMFINDLYLPEEELCKVSTEYGISLVDIYGVATFYSAFSLKPRGKHLISACLGTACHVRGGQAIANEIGQQLNVEAGETTSDKEFTFETVNCLGACALGPVVTENGDSHHHMSPGKLRKLVDSLHKADAEEIPDGKD